MTQLNPTQLSPTQPSAVVVGGGIGGVAAALRLRESGAAVTLLETAPEFGEVGAGLQLAPNATRLLKDWGLLEKVLATAVAPRHLVFRDAVTGQEILRQDVRGEFEERYGAPYIVAHRADLHAILVEAAREAGVELLNGVNVVAAENTTAGAKALAEEGRAFEADAVIAADGIRSVVRDAFGGADEPVASGYVAFRGALPISEVTHASDMEDVVVWLGPRCHLVQYPLRRGEMFNTVAVFQSPAFLRGEEVWGSETELEEAYKDCVPEVRSALKNLWRVRSWPMFDRIPISKWTDGNVALLGDSAHAMLQYLAQGACQALEDVEVLTREVRENVTTAQPAERREAWARALRTYNEVREPRTTRVQTIARIWGESWHVDEPVAVLVRNMLFQAAEARGGFPYADWLYGTESLTATEPVREELVGIAQNA